MNLINGTKGKKGGFAALGRRRKNPTHHHPPNQYRKQRYREKLRVAIESSRLSEEKVPLGETDPLTYFKAHSTEFIQRHFPIRFVERQKGVLSLEHRLPFASSRWNVPALSWTSQVIGLGIYSGERMRLVHHPIPFELLETEDRARLNLGDIWRPPLPDTTVRQRKTRPAAGRVVTVTADEMGALQMDSSDPEALHVVREKYDPLPPHPLTSSCPPCSHWFIVSCECRSVMHVHCSSSSCQWMRQPHDEKVTSSLSSLLIEGWLCFGDEGQTQLIGLEMDPCFDALWKLRRLAVSPNDSLEKARHLIVTAWCANAVLLASAEQIPHKYEGVFHEAMQVIHAWCRERETEYTDRLGGPTSPIHHFAAEAQKRRYKSVLFLMRSESLDACSALRRHRPTIILQWLWS